MLSLDAVNPVDRCNGHANSRASEFEVCKVMRAFRRRSQRGNSGMQADSARHGGRFPARRPNRSSLSQIWRHEREEMARARCISSQRVSPPLQSRDRVCVCVRAQAGPFRSQQRTRGDAWRALPRLCDGACGGRRGAQRENGNGKAEIYRYARRSAAKRLSKRAMRACRTGRGYVPVEASIALRRQRFRAAL
eukprot:IDg10365t1